MQIRIKKQACNVIRFFFSSNVRFPSNNNILEYFMQLTIIQYEGRISIIADKPDLIFFLTLNANFLRKAAEN